MPGIGSMSESFGQQITGSPDHLSHKMTVAASDYLHNRPNSKAKRKIDFSHAPHFLSGRKIFPKSLPTQPPAELPLCLIGQNWTYGHP